MALSYLFQFLDKSALGFTAIMSLRSDLSVSGSQYSWASGIYYFGYLGASYPVAWLLVRLPVGKTIACSVYVMLRNRSIPIEQPADHLKTHLGRYPDADRNLFQCPWALGHPILPRCHRSCHRTRPHCHRGNVV